MRWIVSDQEFREHYAQAREAAGFAHSDKMIEIAQDVLSKEGVDPNRARVAMDILKWNAERMAPKSHVVRAEMDLLSSDGSMRPAPTEIVLRGVKATIDDAD